jgi:hypothetical protein
MRSVRRVNGRRSVAFAAALLLSILGTAAAALADANARTSVSFTAGTDQTAGKAVRFSYSVRNPPKGSVIDLQRQNNAVGKWTTIKKLRNRSGDTSGPELAIGEYGLRVAVLKNGRLVAQDNKVVFEYGDIQFSALCGADNVTWDNNDGGCNTSAEQIGGNLFSSAATFDASNASNSAEVNILVTPATSCRTMTLSFGESNADEQRAGGSMMLTQNVVQDKNPEVSTTFAGGTLQSTTIKLDGGAFEISDQSTTYTGSGTLEVLENGTLNCYTSNGVVPGTT